MEFELIGTNAMWTERLARIAAHAWAVVAKRRVLNVLASWDPCCASCGKPLSDGPLGRGCRNGCWNRR